MNRPWIYMCSPSRSPLLPPSPSLFIVVSMWREPWQPTPVFLPGESHEQRVTKSQTRLKQQHTHTQCVCLCLSWTQSCPTLCNSMDCSPPGSSVHGVLQARMLEWVAMPFSKECVYANLNLPTHPAPFHPCGVQQVVLYFLCLHFCFACSFI